MRLFLAINLPPELRTAIDVASAPLRAAAPDVRWTSESKLHLTIKFLGEQEESRLGEITAALHAVASKHTATEAAVGGFGAFPNSRKPRVLWIGVENSPRLELLAHDVEQAYETIGFEPEGRAFRPHITLGRIRERPTMDEARALHRAAKRITFEESLPIQSLDLMRSAPDGSAYHLISSAPLSRRES